MEIAVASAGLYANNLHLAPPTPHQKGTKKDKWRSIRYNDINEQILYIYSAEIKN